MKEIETIADVFDWLDISLHNWVEFNYAGNNTSRITPIKMDACYINEYMNKAKICIRVLNNIMVLTSQENKHYIFKRIFRNSYLFFEHLPKELPAPAFEVNTIEDLISVTYWDLNNFYSEVHSICIESGCDISLFCEYELPFPTWVREMDFNNASIEERKYDVMKPTHRRAAVWKLIDQLNLRSKVDKTNLAFFVEAVTGGNIGVRPKDSTAYKTPTKEADKAAAELLKKIGIE